MATDLSQFDPNSVGLKSNNIFGLPFSEEEAQVILLPVPWEVTVSYRPGTARGPEHVFESSLQIDLFDAEMHDSWKAGYHMLPIDRIIRKKSDFLRQCAELIISHLGDGGVVAENEQLRCKLQEVNCGGKILRDWVREMTMQQLKNGKKVGLLGGDHSTPLGFIEALGTVHSDGFGILQIDAHADLRNAYEGFKYSHASIMYNVMEEVPAVNKLVQVGVRDMCDEEADYTVAQNGRIVQFTDADMKSRVFEGETWKDICTDIVAALPQKVYISFDIDGLDPKLCPNTGTPVPGGMEAEQVYYLFKQVVSSGRQIIGFDLNEVSCGEHSEGIDAIVGARILYKLCNYLATAK
jgi:agmatinase